MIYYDFLQKKMVQAYIRLNLRSIILKKNIIW